MIIEKILKVLGKIFSSPCQSCEDGRIRYSHEEWTGKTWLSIYECDKCCKKYI